MKWLSVHGICAALFFTTKRRAALNTLIKLTAAMMMMMMMIRMTMATAAAAVVIVSIVVIIADEMLESPEVRKQEKGSQRQKSQASQERTSAKMTRPSEWCSFAAAPSLRLYLRLLGLIPCRTIKALPEYFLSESE